MEMFDIYILKKIEFALSRFRKKLELNKNTEAVKRLVCNLYNDCSKHNCYNHTDSKSSICLVECQYSLITDLLFHCIDGHVSSFIFVS